MRLADDNISSDSTGTRDLSGSGQRDDTNRLLRSVQDDYRVAREQLEQVDRRLAERQIQLDRHLERAHIASGPLRTMCLVEYSVTIPISQLGSTILGGSARPLDWRARAPSPAGLRIRCFGRFEIQPASGEIKQWHSGKAKSVLQYIVMQPRKPALKDSIMEALWPECSPQAAANNLKVAVHQINSILSGAGSTGEITHYILFSGGSYLINPEIDLRIDVEEFEKHWAAGRVFEKDGHPAEAIREYEKAESLYLGDYLVEELYEEWTLLRREGLKDTYLIILGKLIKHCTSVNDYDSCIHFSQRMLAQDNCREDAYRCLMYSYNKLGQRNRALRWYEICRRIVRKELEMSPEKATADLYERILKGEEIS